MTPILSTVIKSDNGSTEAARTRAYLDNLIDSSPALLPYRYALIDVIALKTDSRVEVYEDREAGKDGVRILWLPETSQCRHRALRWRRMAMDARQQPPRCASAVP